MGYPGDNDQPPWDSTPLETDPWSRHPLSSSAPQQPSDDQGGAPWSAAEPGTAGWGIEQPVPQERPGSWLESAAAPPHPPAAPEWAESQPSWHNDPLSAPASYGGQHGGADSTITDSGFTDVPAQADWSESPSGPQATPWEDSSRQGFEPPTGTHALPVYDSQPYDFPEPRETPRPRPGTGAFEAPGGSLSAQPYETPPFEAPEGALASQPFAGAQSLSPQPTAWPEQPQGFEQQGFEQPPYDGRSDPQPMPMGPHDPYAQPPQDGPPDLRQDGPWRQGPDDFGPGEQWNGDGAPGNEGGKGSRKPLIIGGALVAVVALVAAFVLVQGGDTDKKTTPSAVQQNTAATPDGGPTASAQPSASAEPTGDLLQSRKTDPRPLKLGEVFRKKRFTEKGITYVMSVRKKSTCKESVHGAGLQSVLAKGKCTQFLRATFATSGGKMVGTVGVANLANAAAAQRAAKAATAKDAYVIAVPGQGVTSKIGQGDALGAAWARGHYLIMTWVQLPDGKAIPAKYKKAAESFAQSIVTGSNLGPALHIREETGKPGR